jgi:hypothetical protein
LPHVPIVLSISIMSLYIRPKFNFVYGNVPIVWSFGSHNYIN